MMSFFVWPRKVLNVRAFHNFLTKVTSQVQKHLFVNSDFRNNREWNVSENCFLQSWQISLGLVSNLEELSKSDSLRPDRPESDMQIRLLEVLDEQTS